MYLGYCIIPFFTWLVTGCAKFTINCARERRLAFDLIGYGGMPSNHSAIVSSVAALVAFREGVNHPAFGVALGVAYIVMLDANSLRRQVGKQAEAIQLLAKQGAKQTQENFPVLRKRMGHSRLEILAGMVVGIGCAYCIHRLLG